MEQDLDESFYFEFKDDKVVPKKVMEEVSAFANTFGGYIFIGISDDKQIEGCTSWNEQRIHVAIHDSITPTPSFDVKRFICDTKTIYVIKIEEGSEPPYITSSGKIYERLSSGTFTIKDSMRLSEIYKKKEQFLEREEVKISIPPISQKINNIYGYIDTGFSLTLSDKHIAINILNKINLKSIVKKMENKTKVFNLARVGNSVIYTPGGLTTSGGWMPAHANNFLEIMMDGSAKMRILLTNNNENDTTINMLYVSLIMNHFKEVYMLIMGELFPDQMIYAKKYEALTVLKQFQPTFFYDSDILEVRPEWQEENDKIFATREKYREEVGIDTVVTNDRIPKVGLYTIDKRQMEKWGVEYTTKTIIDELFFSRFMGMGILPTLTDDELNS